MARTPRARTETPTTSDAASSTALGAMPPTRLPPAADPHAVYLLDLSSYVFRAYHAIAPLSNSKGEPTHAVYGTAQMLKRLLDDRRPTHFAVCMDSGQPSFRKAIDPRYKANRPEPPPDLSQQIQRCEALVRAWGMPVFRGDGIEADDFIATVVERLRAEDPEAAVVIVSGDKDLMQLCGAGVVLWDTMRDKVYGPREVEEKFGVPPTQLRDLLALMGDSSDNVPGVPGVGPKTAADLIRKFGDLESMYVALHAGEVEGVRPKLRQNLLDNEAEARLSQRLVTLRNDAEATVDRNALAFAAPDAERAQALRSLLLDLEFQRLADALLAPSNAGASSSATPRASARDGSKEPAPAAPSAPARERRYEAITTLEQLRAFVAALESARAQDKGLALALDTESTSLRPIDATLVGLSLSFEPGRGFYLPIAHRYLGAPAQLPLEVVRAELGPVLADPTLPKIGHNLKFDAEMLALAGMPLGGDKLDTLIAHYLLDPEAPHGLKELAANQLGVTMITYDQVTRKDAQKRGQQLSFDQVPIEDATPYAAADADLSGELAARLLPDLDAAGLSKLLREVEMPLADVLATMELAGIAVDVELLARIGVEVDAQLRSIEERARAILTEATGDADVARGFNLASPRQLEEVLFDKLGLRVIKRTKTARSTDAEVLEELADEHPLPAVVLEHRQLGKLKGTYLDALPKLVSPKSGRLHTNYQQHIAATGRISSTDPNLQNIPVRTDLGRRIREAFVAPPGFVLLSADYSQIELRVLADLSKDPILIDAFAHDEDVHSRTARELFLPKGSTEEPTKDMRRRGKAVNFGVVYGQGEAALGKQLGIPRAEAAEFIARYFDRYAGVARYMQAMIEQARAGEGVRSLLGRRRFLPDIHSGNRALRLQAERIARNTPIQASAADILKLAMIALRDPVVPGARMLLTVHDELVFEVPEAKVAEAAETIRTTMASVVKLAVPLVVDVGWGRSWADAHA
jgi:DNA polymerase-1